MKKIIAAGLTAVLSLGLAGCAATPDGSLVAQKNTDRLKEAALDTEDENRQSLVQVKQSAAERYNFSYNSDDGKVKITVDADVYLPESDSIPMYSLSCTGFTQEQATAIYDYLLSGKKTWIMEGEDYSKEMADSDLLDAKQQIAELKVNTEFDEEARQAQIDNYQAIIDSIEEQYDSLPDKSNPQKIPVDSTFKTAQIETLHGTEEYQNLEANTDDGDMLYISNFALGSDGSSSISYQKETEKTYEMDADVNNIVTAKEADSLCKCDLSYAEAKELADGFLTAAGVPAQLVQIALEKAAIAPDETKGEEEFIYDEDYSAYCFFYGRVIDNTPVAVTASQYLPHDDTAPSWLYESIRILVGSEGIIGIKWEYPVEISETIANDVDILAFSDACEIFEEMAPLVYNGNVEESEDNTTVESSFEVTVDRVELNLMRIKDSGTERTGLYVPAWVFYGTETEHLYYTDEQFADDPTLDVTEPGPWIILAVNAVDGSIIDVTSGY